MSIEMVLYLIGVLHNLGTFLGITLCMSIVAIIISGSVWFAVCDSVETVKRLKGKLLLPVWIFILTGLISLAIPSQKTMYMMLTCNVANKSEIPEKVMKAIELKLDEYIDEVTDKVKK